VGLTASLGLDQRTLQVRRVQRERTRADGKAAVLPVSTGAYRLALAAEKSGIVPYAGLTSLSETGTGRAQAGTTKSFPAALVRTMSGG
jgi:hypothetical protein